LTGDFNQFAEEFRARYNLPDRTANHLLRVYGLRAVEVVEMAGADPLLLEPFSEETGAVGAEILMAFNKENARTLADVLLRRTMAGLGPSLGIGADVRAASICRRYLGWDEERAAEEVGNYRTYVQRYRPKSLTSLSE
jgi:glycerol-3-phosphate dehydrogenase